VKHLGPAACGSGSTVQSPALAGLANAACPTARELLAGARYVVFDLDGTLVDTLPDLVDGLQQALRRHGLALVDAGLVRESLHLGLEGTVDAAVKALGVANHWRDTLFESYCEALERRGDGCARCFPGVEAVLHELSDRGAPLAVCTNKPAWPARRLLARLGLLGHFQEIVGADTCAFRKPHPEPLRWAMHQLGAEAETTLLIGDSAIDLACAQAVGVGCLIFEGGYGGTFDGGRRFASYNELLEPPRPGGQPGQRP
jgi:phosphoglycolate phosphatase